VTAITLNLLVEEQLAQEAQARDPVKIVVAASICLISVAVLVGMAVSRSTVQRTTEADALQAKWDAIQSNPGTSAADTKSYKGLAEEIRAINQARPLYASQLAIIKDVVPDTIQLTQVGLSYVTEEVTAVAPEPAAAPADGEKPARRTRPKSHNHVSLVLSGQASCARPEIEVDEFIKKMKADAALSKLVEEISLRSLTRTSAPADTPGTHEPTVMFSINCQYKDRQ
jgi:hypothetical protein